MQIRVAFGFICLKSHTVLGDFHSPFSGDVIGSVNLLDRVDDTRHVKLSRTIQWLSCASALSEASLPAYGVSSWCIELHLGRSFPLILTSIMFSLCPIPRRLRISLKTRSYTTSAPPE
jgi:hypothetical protein